MRSLPFSWLLTVTLALLVRSAEPPQASPPRPFAPLAAGDPLAELWNDPEFQKRLLGSYGMKPDIEPRMTPEEQAFYRDKVVPALRGEARETLGLLQGRAKPGASAQFDFVLGNVYFQNDDLTNAIHSFEAAIEKFPDFLRAQKNLGFAFLRAGRFEDAIKPLTRTASLGGADGKLFGFLGYCYSNLGRHASALGAYQQALLFEPDNTDFKLGLVKSAISLGNYDQALALLDELIQLQPDKDNLWTLQANVYVQKGQPDKAAIALEMLRRLGNAKPAQLLLLGDLYLNQDARDLALAAYSEGVEKGPGENLPKALRAADILASRGAWKEAEDLLKKIQSSAGNGLPGAEELKWLKLSAKVAMGSGDGPRAIEILEQVVQRNPLDAEALMLAGDFYARNGDSEKAQFRYETAGKIAGFEADAMVKQAQLLVASRKYDGALELLRKAQKVRPRDNVQRYLERVEQVARNAGRRS
ncbi:MAG: tetratricopeptide repeat protein [Verrucomicrobiae bacterium]|nr:tetratricopeptide repeat protein [Verrucomicrobiae bacterium]